MIPSVEQVMHKRHTNKRRLRMWALGFMLVAMMWPPAFAVGWLIDLSRPEKSDVKQMVVFTVFFLVPGLVLWILAGWLNRWLVPLGTTRCPGCGYRLDKLTVARCPECGIPVPETFVEKRVEA